MTHPKRMSSTKLAIETLETRQLLAADFRFGHNFLLPEDADGNGFVSPVDALQVINSLNLRQVATDAMIDINADGDLTPLDALNVLNRLNLATSEEPDSLVSQVPLASRIARIESAIASGDFGNCDNLEEAKDVLTTLRLGGAPELGDRVVDLLTGIRDGKFFPKVEDRLDAIATQLIDLGVDASTVSDWRSTIQKGLDAGESSVRDLIQKGMDELGIDVIDLVENHHAVKQIERIEHRLDSLGVEATVIQTLLDEMNAALDAGTPLTHDQIVASLERLGIDPEDVFACDPPKLEEVADRIQNQVDEWIQRLKDQGVTREKINNVVDSIKAVAESGTHVTAEQISGIVRDVLAIRPNSLTQVRSVVQSLVRRFR